jgi:hypothetical protein
LKFDETIKIDLHFENELFHNSATPLALTATEILLKEKPVFSWASRATNGSSCEALEKTGFSEID